MTCNYNAGLCADFVAIAKLASWEGNLMRRRLS